MQPSGSQSFNVDVSSSEGETVLVVHGELDLWTQPHFSDVLATAARSSFRTVLDFTDLKFIDVGSIGLIHRAQRLARLRGCHVVVRSASPHVTRILELSGALTDTTLEDPHPIVLPLPSRVYERPSDPPTWRASS